ncbi:lipase family protein [Corynebacterium aquatimens]|uniref:Pimeloyl-ACP methyl ester carboxylesterase n=1 Tax=Corynebacterium aquatimens TaxID=1190508 RepID=A0A931DY94_9CORY|nr:lipase family protein [Corynebacterium aquatimens]MBG6122330.1 pimeloyl-ACP methyl ester carboxylesterase [Corynebacterium aquatimens]WJY65128.1 putative inactive lipase [Corynebacterium aquatimens]
MKSLRFSRGVAAAVAVISLALGAAAPAGAGAPSPAGAPASAGAPAHFPQPAPGSNAKHGYDAFYDAPVAPAKLTKPGTLLRQQNAPNLLNITGKQQLPGSARRILYTSTTVDGKIVPVSGFVIEPAVKWNGAGPTPTVVFGPGTRGAGDACAPSRGPLLLGQYDPKARALGINYEMPNYVAASSMGMRVVVTDYIGLGTPGPHTYVLHTEEGHAMLDAARAVTPRGNPVAFWGYSQGGGAAAAAAEMHKTYAPELNVKGTYAGAPPADLVKTMKGVDNSAILAVLGYAVAGVVDRYPQYRASVERNLSPSGREFLQKTSNTCIPDDIVRWGLRDTRAFTTTGQTLSEALLSNKEVVKLLDSQKLGRRKPSAPIMVSTGGSDDLVPSAQVVQLARDHCSLGANVALTNDGLPPLAPRYGPDHATGMFTQAVPSLLWLKDRFNGVPSRSNCGTF